MNIFGRRRDNARELGVHVAATVAPTTTEPTVLGPPPALLEELRSDAARATARAVDAESRLAALEILHAANVERLAMVEAAFIEIRERLVVAAPVEVVAVDARRRGLIARA